MRESLSILGHFIRTRWLWRFRSRASLLAWQSRRLDGYLRDLVSRSGFYRGRSPVLDELPVMDKASHRENFATLNRAGISLADAESAALLAEQSRDFVPMLPGGITVGLSSGTSGHRGVFLVDRKDRCRWAGVMLARVLSTASLKHLLIPWRPALRVAFFLRADSHLYRTIASRRVDFRYFDLLDQWTDLMARLEQFKPDILIAPATVLAAMATGDAVSIRPSQVVSVAEVLDDRDADSIAAAFGVRPGQIYQATEGFLGWTCEAGSLHVNEEFVHVEPQWLDDAHVRFHPLVTDFTRSSQHFIRYRLDDILVAGPDECACGRHSRVIDRIEGRADEVLWFPEPVFPDVLRQALYATPGLLDLYRIEQHGPELRIALRTTSPEIEREVTEALHAMFERLTLAAPVFRFLPWTPQAQSEKQRRIRCVTPLTP